MFLPVRNGRAAVENDVRFSRVVQVVQLGDGDGVCRVEIFLYGRRERRFGWSRIRVVGD
jgi:hypothetical protein